MKNIAIICEYNPMHNGHIHQIKTIKENFPDSNIIVIISGSFVQRGDFSILNKFDKAEIAIKNGIDLVIEMPTAVTLQSADNFSYYCVKLLNKLNIIDYLSFGIEAKNTTEFSNSIKFIYQNEEKIDKLQKEFIDKGYSYKKSYNMAIESICADKNLLNIISKPNNTLSYQYIKSLKNLNSNIEYFPIIRNDAGYHSDMNNLYEFQSATAIRNLYKSDKEIKTYIPDITYKKLLNTKIYDYDNLSNIFNYLINIEKRNPENIIAYEYGMLNLLKNNFNNSIDEMIEKSHNKRYSKSRLRRFVSAYILDIKQDIIKNLDEMNYIRILALNSNGADIIKQIKEISDIKIISKLANLESLNNPELEIIDIDKKTFLLQNLRYKEIQKLDYIFNPYING